MPTSGLKEEIEFKETVCNSDVVNGPNDIVSVKNNKYNRRFKKTQKPTRM